MNERKIREGKTYAKLNSIGLNRMIWKPFVAVLYLPWDIRKHIQAVKGTLRVTINVLLRLY